MSAAEFLFPDDEPHPLLPDDTYIRIGVEAEAYLVQVAIKAAGAVALANMYDAIRVGRPPDDLVSAQDFAKFIERHLGESLAGQFRQFHRIQEDGSLLAL